MAKVREEIHYAGLIPTPSRPSRRAQRFVRAYPLPSDLSYLRTTLPPSALRRQHFPGESPTPSYLSPLQIPTHHACFGQYTDPPSAIGFWIALEKCTPENGALSFLPGSHLTAPITKRFVRKPEGGTGFEALVPPAQAPPTPEGQYILEACMPGAFPLLSLRTRA